MSHVSRVKGTAGAAAAPMDKENPDVNGYNSAPPSAPAANLVQISPQLQNVCSDAAKKIK